MDSKKRFHRRTALLFIIFGLISTALIGRLVYLQLYDKARYTTLAHAQRIQPTVIDAQRGNIYDRSFNLLAKSIDAYSIHVIPSQNRDVTAAAEQLALYLPIKAEEIKALFEKHQATQTNFWLARKLSLETAAEIGALNIPGIKLITRPQRFYPKGTLAAHVLGIAGIDNQGLEGIEFFYDHVLAGIPGRLEQEKDAVQRQIPGGVENLTPPQNGHDLVLTIDSVIQYIAERELKDVISTTKSNAGVILIIKPTTGEILANAVYPTFNPNNYQAYDSRCFRNIAVTDQYEPGSTFKVLTAASALDSGIVDAEREFYSGPSWSVNGGVIRSSNIYGYGKISFLTALQKSDNITFAQIAVEMGPERFYSYLTDFGFGKKTGIDFPGEAVGILPQPRETIHAETLRWANIGFGQGIAVTPLQLLMAVGAVANEGKLMRPYYVAEIRDEYGKILQKTEPEIMAQPIAEKTAKLLTNYLESAVVNGSGNRAQIIGIEVAGKTGTAQVPDKGGYGDERIASFVGYAPANKPEVAVLVVLYNPQTEVCYGGVLAAPVFQTVVEQTLDYLGVERRQLTDGRTSMSVVPNVRNFPVAEAKLILVEHDLQASYQNTGKIVRDQIPSPGSRVMPYTTVNLFFFEDEDTALIKVPDVLNRSMRDVSVLLTDVGLQLRPVGSGMAVSQTPKAGFLVPEGSVIEVEFLP